ncbi:MAG: DUF3098 domain-containing protein [Bacteroidales bacterium]|jgi:uncharacterized membrane protein YidH (DUF202 family)|nr:DUF3098 domain-containing protein [Bacteroidales bacterium]
MSQKKIQKNNSAEEQNFAMPKSNIIWILIGLGIMVLGYILMIGGGSKDPDVFSPAIFSFTRLVISPILILGGIVLVIVAIMKRNMKKLTKD